MPFPLFHPIVAQWFQEKLGEPTEPQTRGWPAIARGEHTLIAAPTGSGKTLSAFLVCIDRLVRQAVAGDLEDECKILYLSPLKALASDIRKNLQVPLSEIQARIAQEGHIFAPEIRAQVRTGDTPAHERLAISKKPPHILVTTPESLYLMLTSEKGRHALRTVETVIVDEIHALARDKRGSHMTLSLERLKGLTKKRPQMIGLSATQKPIDEIASFLVGVDRKQKNVKSFPCTIVDVGHSRDLDLGLIVPPTALGTVASHEQWEEIYQKIAEQIRIHRSTLIFVNTRRLAERVAFRLSEILGEEQVLSHHGSLSKNRRLNAETMLKEGKLKAIVATASLELGIDIGYIDLVCQIGIPYSIATFLQRIGRAGHAVKATPKGRLVPLTRDELVESLALIRAIKEKQLDRIEIPEAPLDILTQQLIAECAGRGPAFPMKVGEACQLFSTAWPYRNLTQKTFMEVVHMASEGYAPGRRRYAYLIWDRMRDRLTVKGGARIAALTSGGPIPEMGEFRVVLGEDGTMVGTVNEDFAIESMAGDIFLLGTHSWKVRHVRGGEMIVDDAQGQPPTVPFWLGESPGRTKEFSTAVAELRKQLAEQIPEAVVQDPQYFSIEALVQLRELPQTPFDEAKKWLGEVTQVSDPWPLLQAAHYLAVQKAALGIIPSRENIVFERFFDEVGGMQLVIHSSYGARINRGWGLALRKRFCRAFDFELQASADDDGIVMSLGPQQSFPIEQLFKMLNRENVRDFLEQALLAAPMFGLRWRWNASRALAVLRSMAGKRVAPALQRFRSEDLLTAVFPAQTACKENVTGDIEIPDHPLVNQTVHDCLNEAMDIEGLRDLMGEIQKGTVKLIAKDTREPSPFAYQLLNAYPFAFLDDAPLEDRRTRSVAMRPALSIQELQDLDRLDPKAIAQVTKEAWPEPKTPDEWYEVLVATPAFPVSEAKSFARLTETLIEEGRAVLAEGKNDGFPFQFVVAAEMIPSLKAAYDQITFSQHLELPSYLPPAGTKEEVRQTMLKGWLEIRGPVPNEELGRLFALDNADVYLSAIEAGGSILRCRLQNGVEGYTHWCSRGLLRRIHRLTVEGLREQIRPVSAEDYLEYAFEAHGLNLALPEERFRGSDGLLDIAGRLQGFEAPALAWERELFAGRMRDYNTAFLDKLTSTGLLAFGRLTPKKGKVSGAGKGQKLTSVVPLTFALRRDWMWIAVTTEVPEGAPSPSERLSGDAHQVLEALKAGGAQFLDEIEQTTRLLPTQVEGALGELAAGGLVTSDQFHAFRSILSRKRREMGGRWLLLRRFEALPEKREERLEQWARQLLARYGIVFRDLLERESLAPSWGELVRVFRRWEARGEVRGGRFIKGVSGEQYALSETHERLIRIREERANGKRQGSYAVISSADPLNLVGIITKGEKMPSSPSTRLLFEAGELTAICRQNEVKAIRPVSDEKLRALRLIGTFRARARTPSPSPSTILLPMHTREGTGVAIPPGIPQKNS